MYRPFEFQVNIVNNKLYQHQYKNQSKLRFVRRKEKCYQKYVSCKWKKNIMQVSMKCRILHKIHIMEGWGFMWQWHQNYDDESCYQPQMPSKNQLILTNNMKW
jgi:hypothetical protein